MRKLRLWVFIILLVSSLFLPINIVTAQLIATLEGHTDNVWSVAFSPDGKILASGSFDQTVRLWDVETEQLLHILTGHTGEVNSVAFNLDGGTLASGSWDGTIRLWNPNTGKLKKTLTDNMGGIGSVVFSPDGKMLASGSADAKIRLWNTTTWQVQRTLTDHTLVVDSVAFSPDGGTLASGSRDQTIRLWNPNTGKLLHTLAGHTSDITRMAFSPDGSTLASGGRDGAVILWNPQTGGRKNTLTVPIGGHNPVAFSPDEGLLLIGGYEISVWDLEMGEYKIPFAGNIGEVVSVVFSPDGQIVASGGTDNKVRLWKLTNLDVPLATIPFDINNIPEPVPPPAAVRDFFDLSSFYQQWINVGGFPVLASEKVNPYAVKEAAWVIWQMIGHRRDILKVLAQNRKRLTVLAVTESFSDTPEYDKYFNYPTKFFGAYVRDINCSCPITLASEEHLIYPGVSAIIHEFSHAIHAGLNRISRTFDDQVRVTYSEAMEKGLWSGYYASSNRDEYWAEGTGVWFHANDSNPVTTRDALKAYDPGLAKLLTEIFGDGDWRYTAPETRLHLPHLQGLTPQDFPRFDGSPPWEIGAVELEEQLKDPNSDGDGKWVDLKLYHPSLLPSLVESTTRGGDTAFIWVNLTGGEISFYYVDTDGTENWIYTAATKPFSDSNTHVGAIWLIKDHNGEDLAVLRAEEKVGRVLVGPALHLIKPGPSKVSGENQTGVSGALLANPFVIEVRDENLSTLEGISVTFTVTTGNGTLTVTRTTTDENGRAESTLTLGPNQGTNTVSVSAAGSEGTVTFNAEAEAAVDIPDPNLRAAVETALGKASGAPIVSPDMARLIWLIARNANITDLTGLEYATNLKSLLLDGGEVRPGVWGNSNSISDLSPIAGLIHLESLDLWVNSVSDISVLADLTNLKGLALLGNNITDLSPLVANTGLGEGDKIDVRGNPLSYLSLHTYIPALQSRGVEISFDNQAHPALLKISGNNQKGASFTPLSQPFVIEAQDANGSALAGISVKFAVTTGGGTLSTTITRTDTNGRAQSTLTLGPNLGTNTVEVSATGVRGEAIFHAISETESPPISADVNGDGSVNVLDLIVITSNLDNRGSNLAADVNRDGVVNILDLVLVAGMFDGAAAAPAVQPQVPETLTAMEVRQWLTDARALEVRDPIVKRGFVVLEQLLISLTPKETELLANYPNPFNPETWIPYRLAEDAFVTLTIYDLSGQVVRTFEVGHRIAAAYENRSKAIYWDGRNDVGEQVASGVYFYTLTASDFSATRKMLILK